MAKNLIVKLSMKSGKVHEIDIPNPDGKTLEDLVNELNGSRATFVGINDGLLSIRWSEVESLEDVSHFGFNEEKTHEGTNVVLDNVELVEAVAGQWAEGIGLIHKGEQVIPKDNG